MACGILVPWPGIKPVPPALKAQSWPLDQGSSRNVPCCLISISNKVTFLSRSSFFQDNISSTFSFFFSFIFISWRLITLHYCSGFCHTLTWIIHGFTCVPHPEHPSHLPPHPIPLGHPSAPALSTCLISHFILTPRLSTVLILSQPLQWRWSVQIINSHLYIHTMSLKCGSRVCSCSQPPILLALLGPRPLLWTLLSL